MMTIKMATGTIPSIQLTNFDNDHISQQSLTRNISSSTLTQHRPTSAKGLACTASTNLTKSTLTLSPAVNKTLKRSPSNQPTSCLKTDDRPGRRLSVVLNQPSAATIALNWGSPMGDLAPDFDGLSTSSKLSVASSRRSLTPFSPAMSAGFFASQVHRKQSSRDSGILKDQLKRESRRAVSCTF